jgi:hypothetical protein
MNSARFQTLGTNKKVIIVHPQTRYWSPVERTLKLFLTFFLKEKIQTQETGRPFVPVPFFVFLRGRFCKFFSFNRTSKISAVEGVRNLGGFILAFASSFHNLVHNKQKETEHRCRGQTLRFGRGGSNTSSKTVKGVGGGRGWTSSTPGHLHTSLRVCRDHGDVTHGGLGGFVSCPYSSLKRRSVTYLFFPSLNQVFYLQEEAGRTRHALPVRVLPEVRASRTVENVSLARAFCERRVSVFLFFTGPLRPRLEVSVWSLYSRVLLLPRVLWVVFVSFSPFALPV